MRFNKSKIKNILICIILLVDILAISLLGKRKSKKEKKILVVRIDHIGDFLLWIGQANELRKLYPKGEYHLTLIGNESWSVLVPTDIFDSTIFINRNKFLNSIFYRIKICKIIYNNNYETTINTTYSRNILLDDTIVNYSKALNCIGHFGDNTNQGTHLKKISNDFYSKLVKIPDNIKFELEINSYFIKNLGGKYAPILAELSIHSTNKNNLGDNYYVVIPGGSWDGKCWELKKFANIINNIYKKYKIKAVICGSTSEISLGKKLSTLVDYPVVNITGKTNLLDVISIIKNAKFIISNDNGMAHIAPVVKTPLICILGGGHFGRFFPYKDIYTHSRMYVAYNAMDCFSCNWQCTYSVPKNTKLPCISLIDTEKVMEIIDNLISLKIYE
jgi:ADP-heptose:LPS heptosyltransferase